MGLAATQAHWAHPGLVGRPGGAADDAPDVLGTTEGRLGSRGGRKDRATAKNLMVAAESECGKPSKGETAAEKDLLQLLKDMTHITIETYTTLAVDEMIDPKTFQLP
jgi:hypothetical protein